MSPGVVGMFRSQVVRVKRWVVTELGARKVYDPLLENGPLFRQRTVLGTYYVPQERGLSPRIRAQVGAMRRGEVAAPALVALARAAAKPGSVILDVGAGAGQRALALALDVGSRGQVCAVEGEAAAFAVLRRNIAFRRVPIRAFQVALGVDGACVDALDLPRAPDLVVIDESAHTATILRGARETLEVCAPKVIVALGDGQRSEIEAVLQDLGYQIDSFADGVLSASTLGTRSRASLPRIKSLSERRLCEFLRRRTDVEVATAYLNQNGFVSHSLPCKDWDLARIIPEIGEGNLLDMGSSDSYILKNVALRGMSGELYGIDLRPPDVAVREVRYLVGDLMDVPVRDGFFRYVTCLSVIEHAVDFRRLATEAARLLEPGGLFFVTFDYWEPQVHPTRELYGLKWQPLAKEDLERFLAEANAVGLELVEDMNWSLRDAVINADYFSPEAGVNYTFGLVTMRKKG